MRIAFCGKGGSGKSTISSLVARYLAYKNKPVLIVDGDINQHLGEALGFEEEALTQQPKLGVDPEVFFEFIKGTNELIESTGHILESTPAGQGSGLMYFNQKSPVSEKYEIQKNGLRFMSVGGHQDDEVGQTCYHKFTGAFGVFLNHFVDGDHEYLIGDMCAGADPFASSGLASRFDAVFLVVEPTLKSAGVYNQCKQYGDPFGIKIFVIGNKVENAEDEEFIKGIVGEDYLGSFEKSNFVRDMEKGRFSEIDQLEENNIALLQKVIDVTDTLQKNWTEYQKTGWVFHRQAASSWANELYDADVSKQIDESFSYLDVLPNESKAA